MRINKNMSLQAEPYTRSAGNWILGVDTSTVRGGVALISLDKAAPLSIHLPDGVRTSRVLLPAIRDLLKQADIRDESISAVGASLGPGSFTGIRIGLATVKGLVLGLGCPLYGISSLDALADSALNEWMKLESEAPDWILPCRDARHGELFSALFQPVLKGDKLYAQRKSADTVSSRDNFSLPEEGKILIVAPENDRPELNIGGKNRRRVLYSDMSIAPVGVARLTRQAISLNIPSAGPGLEAIYGRKPRAETQWSSEKT